jgi:prepilin-type processing-associated H-X9-DG protein
VTIPAVAAAPAYAAPAKKSSAVPIVIIILVVCLGVLVVCGGILTALLLPAVQAAREAARRANCVSNLKQITIAMHEYHDANGSFPPAYLADEDGNPMHSWRVLLLPFLEEKLLYDQYDFDQPWNSPHNQALADLMPAAYRCPSDENADLSETSYVMIVGPGTIGDGPNAAKNADITDGMHNTIMLVEMADSGINWLEPRDLDVQEMSFEVNDPAGNSISSRHPGVANVAFADGSVQSIDDDIDPETVKAMTTIAGGEEVSEFYEDY